MEEQAHALTASVSVFKLQAKVSAPAHRPAAVAAPSRPAAARKTRPPAVRAPEPVAAGDDHEDWQTF